MHEIVSDGPTRVIGLVDAHGTDTRGDANEMPVAEIFEVADGKVTEVRPFYWDQSRLREITGTAGGPSGRRAAGRLGARTRRRSRAFARGSVGRRGASVRGWRLPRSRKTSGRRTPGFDGRRRHVEPVVRSAWARGGRGVVRHGGESPPW